MRTLTAFTAVAGVFISAAWAEKKLALKDLPPAVQKTIEAELKGGEIKTISKEKENGVSQYEVETLLEGKHRDISVDVKGNLLVVEEETELATLPAAARATIEKKAAGGKIGIVER